MALTKVKNGVIGALAVDTAELAANAVTTAKITDANVTTAKLADNAVTLAKLAGGSAGALLGFNVSGDPAEIDEGTAAQVLTSNGPGAVPTMQAAPIGAWEFLDTVTMTGGAAALLGEADTNAWFSDSTYKVFKVFFYNVDFSGSANMMCFRVGTGATPTIDSGAGNYNWAVDSLNTNSAAFSGSIDNSDTLVEMQVNAGPATSRGNAHGEVTIFNPSSSTKHTRIAWNMQQTGSAGTLEQQYRGTATYLENTAITAIQFIEQGGDTIDTGEFRLYGLKDA